MDELDSAVTDNPQEFWKMLNNLGPRKSCDIPLEIYDENGEICNDINQVLDKWRSEYNHLYNFQTSPGVFDDEFRDQCEKDLNDMNDSCDCLPGINDAITLEEVVYAISVAKLRKAVGIDNLPNEILKNENTYKLMHVLFSQIFESGVMPTIWKSSIIKPIPKSALLDSRLPLQYRGISLLSTVYKIFSSVLNRRISNCIEINDLVADEQNGFRKDRSCLDHVYSLTSIIRCRKKQGLSTYVAFIDMEKAFDRVDRMLLFYKMLRCGIGGKIYQCLRNMYDGCKSCINVNGFLTEDFPTEFGVKQGDCLSPTLFNLYINDFVEDLKDASCGVNIGMCNVHCLLYADDIALIAATEEDLQNMLSILENWCKKWRMKVNSTKSNIVHFRPCRVPKTSYLFVYNMDVIEIVSRYKYLGIVLDEMLDYSVTANVLADSGGRALGSLYTKFRNNKGFGYTTYTKMFDSCVSPILDYCSGVWGYNKLEKLDTVQNRAIRLFLGVHRFTPNKAINGDMGWIPSRIRRHVNILRLWNRLIGLSSDRLTRKIFDYDKSCGEWCKSVRKILLSINCNDYYDNHVTIDLYNAKGLLFEVQCDEWKTDVHKFPKLRTYLLFKHGFYTEPYVTNIYNRGHRSALAQLRCGVLPLSIETGRFQSIPLELRLCTFCSLHVIEDEVHFLLYCSFYNELRNILFSKAEAACPGFLSLNEIEKMSFLMDPEVVKCTARYVFEAMTKRRKLLFHSH